VILPPDPGSEGKKTLEGIDSNNNGVRDDVEIAIYKYAPKPEQDGLRQALLQTSKGLQAAILAADKNDTDGVLKAQKESARATDCLFTKMTDKYSTSDILFIERQIANTDARAKAYIRYNKMLSGRIFSAKSNPIPCDSDREKEAKAQAAFNAKTFNVQSVYNLPPDPKSEGKKTLEGIDSNNNGIRDDVEIAIYNYAPRLDQERYRAGLIQLAKAMQTEVKVSAAEFDTLWAADQETLKAIKCLKQTSLDGVGLEEFNFVRKLIHNTPQRDNADTKFNNRIKQSGKAWWESSDDPNPCDYDKR
ncbi:MAG: hypothetical protein LBP89_02020, partial [Helicobacteraceae bacterium]|nr:hypothetical protein [Helicobacteraceae bacterium]